MSCLNLVVGQDSSYLQEPAVKSIVSPLCQLCFATNSGWATIGFKHEEWTKVIFLSNFFGVFFATKSGRFFKEWYFTPDDSLTNAWRLPDECLTNAWRLPDDSPTTADDYLTTAWQLPDDYLMSTIKTPQEQSKFLKVANSMKFLARLPLVKVRFTQKMVVKCGIEKYTGCPTYMLTTSD